MCNLFRSIARTNTNDKSTKHTRTHGDSLRCFKGASSELERPSRAASGETRLELGELFEFEGFEGSSASTSMISRSIAAVVLVPEEGDLRFRDEETACIVVGGA